MFSQPRSESLYTVLYDRFAGSILLLLLLTTALASEMSATSDCTATNKERACQMSCRLFFEANHASFRCRRVTCFVNRTSDEIGHLFPNLRVV